MSDRATAPIVRSVTDAQRASSLRAVNHAGWGWRALIEWARVLIIAVALFAVVRTIGVEAFKIPSGSMEQTLRVGDFLLVNKAIYGAQIPFTPWRLPAFAHPARGDVIVFRFPKDPSKTFVKRLIGLPGDTVAMRNGRVWLDGVAEPEPYVLRTEPGVDPGGEEFGWQRSYLVQRAEASSGYHPSRNNWGPLVVPSKSYFVLGDNRDNSYDSRYWGFVADSLVEGQPLFVYYSYRRSVTDRFPWLTDVRWGRIGTVIR